MRVCCLSSKQIESNRIEQLWPNTAMPQKSDIELMTFNMYIEFHICEIIQFGNECM